MELIDYIDLDEGRESAAIPECFNCEAKTSQGVWLSEFTLPEGTEVWGCDDCIEEQKRVESKADELAKMPSCARRQSIIDQPELTVHLLVNALKAHDVQCSACASTRKTVQDDRLYLVTPAAVCCEVGVA